MMDMDTDMGMDLDMDMDMVMDMDMDMDMVMDMVMTTIITTTSIRATMPWSGHDHPSEEWFLLIITTNSSSGLFKYDKHFTISVINSVLEEEED
jgi:hypothetical protein